MKMINFHPNIMNMKSGRSACSFTHAHQLPPPQSSTTNYRAWRCCIFPGSVPLENPQWQAKMALFAGEGAALNAYGAIFVQSEQQITIKSAQ